MPNAAEIVLDVKTPRVASSGTRRERFLDEWAAAYVRAQRDPTLLEVDEHPLRWAVRDLVLPLGMASAEDCWEVVLRILRLTSDSEVLNVLVAGPLAYLIADSGRLFIDRIEAEAWRSPKFRKLLHCVWRCGPADVWARIDAVRELPTTWRTGLPHRDPCRPAAATPGDDCPSPSLRVA
ncbi:MULTISPECIES: DUF6869 domain-containing protein [Ramlibacter]|uniref:DUF6869 domain-containing protein n=1 Tax=Ramlibacter pinisoli TaxID=2682844 RepID=A0A6N8J0K9_9BURK|nr:MULTISPECIES: hypothetical protein [Ramlibacter]MBA2961858.1 hypothetical protein [Ramlibacter sp. CGMCC 1.13660]MVQ31800.1 hypothetical protein [Ramlibacter pinisoli]